MGSVVNGPLSGKVIALAETRELDLLSGLLEKKGGSILRCPLVAIVDNPDTTGIETWLRTFIAERTDYLILFTGEGLRRLLGFANRAGIKEEFVSALKQVQKITRGPKPARALRELGLAPDVVAPEPTTDGILQALATLDLTGKQVAVQLYTPTQEMRVVDALREKGAVVTTVAPYQYASASDSFQVGSLIEQLMAGMVHVIAFTSASQIDRLLEVATERNAENGLRSGLDRVRVAAIGPVAEKRLNELGIRVDIVPEGSFFMAPLVNAIVASFSEERSR